MKNRLLCMAMAVIFAIGMISCGKPATPDDFEITADNVDNYIVSIGDYDALKVGAEIDIVTDEMISHYADSFYEAMAKETDGLTDESGKPIPMTDEAIAKLGLNSFSTVAEYMVFMKDCVEQFSVDSYQEEIVAKALKKVVSNSEFTELPEALLQKEKNLINAKYEEQASLYELSSEEYLKYCKTSIEELAEQYAKTDLVTMKIAKDMGFDMSDAESVNREVSDYLKKVTIAE